MLWIAIQHASACGMTACDAGPTPVIQNAERIAFAIDEEAGIVEAHVQVFYEGPPDEFAWVVPVSSQPEVFVSNDALFAAIQTQLAPQIQLGQRTIATCKGEGNRIRLGGCRNEFAIAAPQADDFDDTGASPDVVVVSTDQVGPYDVTTLQADTETALVDWLLGEGFEIPTNLGPLLAPYLSDDAHFLAVRLSKDSDSGDIAPLGWRYRGDRPAVPIQLTAIAAAPDMGLEVSVFARHRGVPESYLHVVVNEANIDWFGGGANYFDLVSRAADQAGGHAFATDYSGTPSMLRNTLWSTNQGLLALDLQAAAASGDVEVWRDIYLSMVLPDNANTEYALSLHLEGDGSRWSDRLFSNAAFANVDLEALTADLDTYVFEPLRRADALFDHPTVTRMSSSLDASEMTVDPVFVQNPDMGEVSNLHIATLATDCTGKPNRFDAPRLLELEDGRIYQLPSMNDIADRELTDSEYWTAKHSDIEAIRIEETGPTGAPAVIADLTEDAVALTDGPVKACGCSGNALRGTGLFAVLCGALLARRRRS